MLDNSHIGFANEGTAKLPVNSMLVGFAGIFLICDIKYYECHKGTDGWKEQMVVGQSYPLNTSCVPGKWSCDL